MNTPEQEFLYRGIDAQDRPVTGRTRAPGPDQATARLRKQEITVTSIQPLATPARTRPWPLQRRASADQVAGLCAQLAGLLETDLPLPAALAALARDAQAAPLRAALTRVAAGLEQGRALGELLAAEPALPALLGTLVRAGEESGKLPEILRLLATHSWRMQDLRNRVRAAFAYPLFVLALLLVVLGVTLAMITPQLASMFTELGMEIPVPAQASIWVSRHFFAIAGTCAAATCALLGAFFHLEARIMPCASIRRWLLFHLPLLGRIARASYLYRFCRLLELLLPTGMSLERIFLLLAHIDKHTLAPRGVQSMVEAVERGGSLADAMRLRLHAFPDILVWMVGACEGTDRLQQVFGEMAAIYEAETRRSIEMAQVVLSPTMMVIAGLGVVGGIIFPVFLPIYYLFLMLG